MKLLNSLIILTAVIIAQDVNEDVDLLANLPTQSLDCSLQFDRDFVANKEEVAAAIEALLENNASEESGASRRDRPSNSEDSVESVAGGATERVRGDRNDVEAGATRPPRGDKPCDSSSEETDEEESVVGEETSADEEPLRRALRGRGRGGRRNRDVTREAGATRPPRGDNPCDSSDSEEDEETDVEENTLLRRVLRGRGRGGRRNRNDVTLEVGATRPPRGDKPCDSSSDEESDEEETAAEEEPVLRRALRGRGRGGRRNRNDVTLEAGATRPPRGDKPCDSSEEETDEEESDETETDPVLRRALRGRGRRGRRNRDVTLEAGATRPPRGDKPCDSSSEEETDEEESVADEETATDPVLRRALRGRGRRGRRNRDVTLEAGATRPPRGDKPCDSSSDEDEEAVEEDPLLRRALRGRGRRGRGNRNDVTLEAGATRPPRGDRPCDSSDETEEETTAGEDPILRRLLRRGRDSSESETDEVTRESVIEREPCARRSRGRNNRRSKDTTTETPEEPAGVARRELRVRRSRRVEATISNGSIEVAGLIGEVVFGEVNEDLESMPLTITVGETAFTCDVEIRRGNKMSCRAKSEDNFHLRVGCEIPADEERTN